MSALDLVMDTVTAHGSKTDNVRQNGFMAQCPGHEDGRPSLSVKYQNDKVLMHCFAGCNTDDVLAIIGLEPKDLFDTELEPTLRGGFQQSVPIRSYLYQRANGEPWFFKDRWYPKFFTLRLPDTQPGNREGIKGRAPILYHVPQMFAAFRKGPTTVYLVDGEKDVETAEAHGLVATCPPSGSGSAWDEQYAVALKDADMVVIVTDQDPDRKDGKLGSGQTYAMAARSSLRAAGISCRVVKPAVGKDLTDHFSGGYEVSDLMPDTIVSIRPRGMNAETLMRAEFEPIRWAVHGLIPEGVSLLAGSPKAGKSWAALDICLAVASGGPALSEMTTEQGSCLYLAREDTYRRLQSRIAMLQGGEMRGPKALELVPAEHDWPGGMEGLANLTEWWEEADNPRLVVLDTIAKIEPEMGEGGARQGAYAGNYSMMARYKTWADAHRVAILMIHHDRKAAPSEKKETGLESDPFSRISGTRGLTGAADTLMFLESVRGTRTGTLYVTGRDVVEQAIELQKFGPTWTAMYPPESV